MFQTMATPPREMNRMAQNIRSPSLDHTHTPTGIYRFVLSEIAKRLSPSYVVIFLPSSNEDEYRAVWELYKEQNIHTVIKTVDNDHLSAISKWHPLVKKILNKSGQLVELTYYELMPDIIPFKPKQPKECSVLGTELMEKEGNTESFGIIFIVQESNQKYTKEDAQYILDKISRAAHHLNYLHAAGRLAEVEIREASRAQRVAKLHEIIDDITKGEEFDKVLSVTINYFTRFLKADAYLLLRGMEAEGRGWNISVMDAHNLINDFPGIKKTLNGPLLQEAQRLFRDTKSQTWSSEGFKSLSYNLPAYSFLTPIVESCHARSVAWVGFNLLENQERCVLILLAERYDHFDLWASNMLDLLSTLIELLVKTKYREHSIAFEQHLVAVGANTLAVYHDALAEFHNNLRLILSNLQHSTDQLSDSPVKSEISQSLSLLKKAVIKFERYANVMTSAPKGLDVIFELVDLIKIVEELKDTVTPLAVDRKVKIEIDAPGSLLIRSEPFYLRQALFNLLVNAIQHTDTRLDDKVKIRIDNICDVIDNNIINIEIENEGWGIHERDKERIFEPFFTTRGREGIGLGLFVVKRNLQQIGASIGIRSIINRRTIFSIILPRATYNEIKQKY